jgi:hypothetical protein
LLPASALTLISSALAASSLNTLAIAACFFAFTGSAFILALVKALDISMG